MNTMAMTNTVYDKLESARSAITGVATASRSRGAYSTEQLGREEANSSVDRITTSYSETNRAYTKM